DRLLALACKNKDGSFVDEVVPRKSADDRPVIAVARDEAFHFTYEDNLDLLRDASAEIAFFSPMRDEALPAQTAGIILSGGFPEVHAARLAANHSLHSAL